MSGSSGRLLLCGRGSGLYPGSSPTTRAPRRATLPHRFGKGRSDSGRGPGRASLASDRGGRRVASVRSGLAGRSGRSDRTGPSGRLERACRPVRSDPSTLTGPPDLSDRAGLSDRGGPAGLFERAGRSARAAAGRGPGLTASFPDREDVPLGAGFTGRRAPSTGFVARSRRSMSGLYRRNNNAPSGHKPLTWENDLGI
jgi:hypothetical protein